MNQFQKIKPQLGFSILIDSSHSLHQFSKKNPKFLFKLKIIKRSEDYNYRKNQFHKLLQLSSSLKSLKSLDLSSSNIQNFKFSHLKRILKKFYHIHRYSVSWKTKTNKNLFPAFLLLKHAKYLTDLSVEVSLNHLSRRFFSLMHLSKIKTLQLTQIPSKNGNEVSVDLSKFLPSTIENLDLRSLGSNLTKWKFPLLMGHMRNLQRLELGIALSLSDLKSIMRSIQEPEKLNCLRLDIKQEYEKEGEIEEIGIFLRKCLNLEELNIKTNLAGFYSEDDPIKLKRLVIIQTVNINEDILRVGDFIKRQQESLESLNLNLSFTGQDDLNLAFERFLEELKSLKKLKRLVLKINIRNLKISKALTELIEELNYLEEIDFDGVLKDFCKESLEKFFKALIQRHSESLKSLILTLNDCFCSNTIIQTLKRLPKLEDLTLLNFGIEKGSNFYLDLRDIVCYKNPNLPLNSVSFTNVERNNNKEHCENVIEMTKDIIRKPSMKKFCYLEVWTHELSEEFSGLKVLDSVADVLPHVYHFNYLYLPSYMCEPLLFSCDLDMHKWAEEWERDYVVFLFSLLIENLE